MANKNSKQPDSDSLTRVDEYKGHPTLSLLRDESDKFPFTFGVPKAKLILANIQAIKKFVDDNDNADGR